MKRLLNMRKPLAIDPSLSMRKPFGMLILLVFLFAMSTGAAASILTDSFDFEGQDYGLERVAYASDDGFLSSGCSLSCGLINVVLTSEWRTGFRLTERGLSIMPNSGNRVSISAGGRQITSVVLEMYSANARLRVNDEDETIYSMKKITLPINAAQCDIDFNLLSQNTIITMTVSYDGTVSELRDPEMSFSETECYVALSGDFTPPILSKATDAMVTYSSSNTEVADVAMADGMITVIAPGTTVITARCEETSVFAAGEANYTLTVIDSYKGLDTILKTEEGTLCSVDFPLTVTYVAGADTYVEHGQHAGLIRGAAEYLRGDIIAGSWTARHSVEHGLDILIPYGAMPSPSGRATVTVNRVDAVDRSMVNSVVELCDVIFAESTPAPGDKQYFTGRCGDRSYTFVNEYSEVPSTEAGIYDVQVAVSCYDGYLRLYPLHYGQCVSREPQIMGERTFKISTEVTLSATDGAVIYYTDNLTDDPSQFTQYIAPLTLTTTTTLRAYAREWGKQPSPMCEATFTRQDSGIETVPADQCDSIRYITFQGLELSAPPASGPYIELRNGCARKILRR